MKLRYMDGHTWYQDKQGDAIIYIYTNQGQEFYEICVNRKNHTVSLNKKILSKDMKSDYFNNFVEIDTFRVAMDLQKALNDYISEIPLGLRVL